MSMDLASDLIEAIRSGGSVDIDAVPQPDLGQAYAIQSDVLGRLGVTPSGYKLSLRSDGVLSAPLLSATETADFPYEPGLKLEVEIALVLARDLPVRDHAYSRSEVRDAIAEIRMGIEYVRSRYATGPQGRTALLVADLMSNVGYRIGPKLDARYLDEGWTPDHVRIVMDERTLFDAEGQHPDGDPLAAVVAYANIAERSTGVLQKGMIVTTGSLCGGVILPAAAAVSVSLGQTSWKANLSASLSRF